LSEHSKQKKVNNTFWLQSTETSHSTKTQRFSTLGQILKFLRQKWIRDKELLPLQAQMERITFNPWALNVIQLKLDVG
jgi:hypothetical protein